MRQRLGQHFLRDPNVVQTIVAAAELEPSDTALEIGPGKGILTEPLAARVAHLVAVELDDALAHRLQQRFQSQASVQIIHGDFLKMDLTTLTSSPAASGRGSIDSPPATAGNDKNFHIKVLGNLPYSITSPIFEKLMPWEAWDTGIFLIQREVAARITARPGSRDYGILSLAVQLFADAETVLQVKPGAFLPPPQVSSSVIRLRRKARALLPSEAIPDFFDLVHGAFAHRRKTIANSLAFHSQISRAEVEKWLGAHGISPACRAETVALADYAKLAGAWSIFRRERNLT
jgi:16S rRNA (adenine1518-N6/adenine1519-N6)-dimethyltransferase